MTGERTFPTAALNDKDAFLSKQLSRLSRSASLLEGAGEDGVL